ncbi:MAG: hypothetical protein CL927_19205 [Deltaproteobacteria bacterium]|nr:hypothetical protein [Deltaproteobacteria bacterium]HCH63624.1 hypothetical protein [Deltaproteobacteria bacterium]
MQAQCLEVIAGGISRFLTGEHAFTDEEIKAFCAGMKQEIESAIPEVAGALRAGIAGLPAEDSKRLTMLTNYVESRLRRDQIPDGLKWIGRTRAKFHV